MIYGVMQIDLQFVIVYGFDQLFFGQIIWIIGVLVVLICGIFFYCVEIVQIMWMVIDECSEGDIGKSVMFVIVMLNDDWCVVEVLFGF